MVYKLLCRNLLKGGTVCFMTGFLLSVIAVVNLLCILVASMTLLTKKLTKWLKAVKKMMTAFHDLWKK